MIALSRRKTRRSRIGVDIGAVGVRAVQLTVSEGATVVSVAAAYKRAAEGAGAGTDGVPDALLLKSCLEQVRFRGREVVAVLSPPDLEFHALQLPEKVLDSADVAESGAVNLEIERLVTTPGSTPETRYWRLPPPAGSNPNLMGVAAGREVIHKVLSACHGAGVCCRQVDAAAAGLVRFGAALRDWPGDHVWGLLDLGARQSRLVLCVDDTAVLVRTAGVGGDVLTARIGEALSLTSKAAEIHKRDHGIADGAPATVRGAQASVGSELAAMLLSALRGDLNDLAAEVKCSYEYVLRCYPGREAGDLLLVGGGARLRGISEFLANALGIGVQLASDGLNGSGCELVYRFGGDHPIEHFAVAIGAAMGDSA